ncbi:hypothetical protein JCGZ_17051 [Jatropha curcas]|uniref:Histone acetyltransferase n=1 Tax=Jatropha curcas TaxID=180498 RepID=A0A067KEL4_JATCU|nr:uncharacterized protein LOC105641312 [Jatropha curcas]KDP30269.1 hypothetical protein JCGZ_17051 [Jatropha curcas]
MPRPGPRPYECVRRAWHSDRHQPIRGSIIQQIFRVVNETHSVATKKNKEWQEKLPIVVLKAEEIMYSKANSEAEYMNPDTLWDRLNDAVNTIIRRDENSETGEHLPPCIEAALNLGCIPVRASRSQRHSNPRSYLSSRVQEPASAPLRVLEKANDKQCPQLTSFQSSSQINFARSTGAVNSAFPVSESNLRLTETSNVAAPCSYPLTYENTSPGRIQLMTQDTNKQLNFGSVYPLYYGNNFHIKQQRLVSQFPEKTNSNNIVVGKPISTSVREPAEMGVLHDFFSCTGAEISAKSISHADMGNGNKKPLGTQCDLSLRLGLFADPCMSVERNSFQETEDDGSSSSLDRGKFSDFCLHKNKELRLSPSRNTDIIFESCPIKQSSVGEDENLDTTFRKRKAPFSDNVEDGQFCWQPEFPSNRFIGRIERPGL